MILVLAALAMIVQDVFSVLKVQAQARNHGWLAGIFDELDWLAAITTTTVSVTVFQGHSLSSKVTVVVLIAAANMIGQTTGVAIGRRVVKDDVGKGGVNVPVDPAVLASVVQQELLRQRRNSSN